MVISTCTIFLCFAIGASEPSAAVAVSTSSEHLQPSSTPSVTLDDARKASRKWLGSLVPADAPCECAIERAEAAKTSSPLVLTDMSLIRCRFMNVSTQWPIQGSGVQASMSNRSIDVWICPQTAVVFYADIRAAGIPEGSAGLSGLSYRNQLEQNEFWHKPITPTTSLFQALGAVQLSSPQLIDTAARILVHCVQADRRIKPLQDMWSIDFRDLRSFDPTQRMRISNLPHVRYEIDATTLSILGAGNNPTAHEVLERPERFLPGDTSILKELFPPLSEQELAELNRKRAARGHPPVDRFRQVVEQPSKDSAPKPQEANP